MIPGDMVYFKFRSIVGVVVHPPMDLHGLYSPSKSPARVDVMIVSAPEKAPYRKGEIIWELKENLEPFDIDRGAHLLSR